MPTARTLAFAALGAVAPSLPALGLTIAGPALGQAASHLTLALGDQRWSVQLTAVATGWQVRLRAHGADGTNGDLPELTLRDLYWCDDARTVLQAECDGMVESAVVAQQDGVLHLFHAGRAWTFERVNERKRRESEGGGGAVTAPLTGRVVDVAVREGDEVTAGQCVAVLEAMKMEHTLTAPIAGRVTELCVQAGGQAAKGALMLRIEALA